MEKSCENCMEYIVCWGMGEPKVKVCDNWKIDIMTYQKLRAENKEEADNILNIPEWRKIPE